MSFSSTLFFSPQMLITKIPFSPSPLPLPIPKLHNFRICFSSSSTQQSPPPPSPLPFDLRGYWTSLISEIESELDAAVPVRYPERIHEAIRYSVLSGSAKRASPVMCVAACELVGGDRSAALPTAAALEMVHAASLVHDDLPCFDASPIRRGRPSTHAAFGVAAAVLAGDALFPLCFTHILARTRRVPDAALARVAAEIARAVGHDGMAAGQFLDLDASAEDVVLVLEKKFGEMAECSAVCGGILGGAGEEDAAALRRYGRAVGVLYQLVDDILMEEERGVESGKMRSNASVVKALGIERAMEMVDELRGRAKVEIQRFGDKYGNRVLPLCSFVDYAVERGFVVKGGDRSR